MTPHLTTPPRLFSATGFTLAECMLSVAITATSLLTVLGLLTGTLDAARESKDETVAGVLLRQLAGEVRDPDTAAPPAAPPAAAASGGEAAQPLILLVDDSMKVLQHSRYDGPEVAEAYRSGSLTFAAAAFARVDRLSDPQDPLLDRVIIRVESPASAPEGNRKVRRYALLSPK